MPVSLSVVLAGCSSYGVVRNKAITEKVTEGKYSFRGFNQRMSQGETILMLSFSGGGTRAAALSYGLLQELHQTSITSPTGTYRLIDEVDSISSVSGGSFTAAYYGLFGDRIFQDYETEFLRHDVQGDLIYRLVNPINWFRSTGRTERAIKYYEDHIFRNSTFQDLQSAGGPMIIINASDLSHGLRFRFIQEYFNLLCSDLSSFPVSSAVTASSAVPGLFNPVVLKNNSGCGDDASTWLEDVREIAAKDPELDQIVSGLESYSDKERRPYVHLVDGGITDNLGVRGVYDITKLSGGIGSYYRILDRKPPRRFILVSVNASTEPDYGIDSSSKHPPITKVMSAVSGAQLHLYNASSLELAERVMNQWAEQLSTPERPVKVYVISLDFEQIEDPARRSYVNNIPTTFSLTGEQVDELIRTGAELLRNSETYQRLLADIERGL